jgi:hypothetical protein
LIIIIESFTISHQELIRVIVRLMMWTGKLKISIGEIPVGTTDACTANSGAPANASHPPVAGYVTADCRTIRLGIDFSG